MKRFVFLLFTLLLALYCTEEVKEPAKLGGISGVVADKVTGEPVPTVNVKLEQTGASFITGSDGCFSFTNLKDGQYSVLLSKDGYKESRSDVQISDGSTIESHFLIERIPAVLTVDKTELDFGDNYSNTFLSFSIVNNNYVDLDWEIVWDHDCKWIKEIDPRKSIVKLGYGKTQSIAVIIDREALREGASETKIVVRTADGSSDPITIKAYRHPQRKPALNILKSTNITSSSAILNAEITDEGVPEYDDCGFVIGDSTMEMPTLEKKIKVIPAGVDRTSKKFSVSVSDLTYGTKYYVRAYARNSVDIAYSTNQDPIVTLASKPSVTVKKTESIESYSAVLNAIIVNKGEPEYTERGFVLGETEWPTLNSPLKYPVDKNAEDSFSKRVTGLKLGQKYFVRAYVTNAIGSSLSTDQDVFTTVAEVPAVEIRKTDDVKSSSAVLNAEIINKGIPEYKERGFVLGNTAMPIIGTAVKIPVSKDSENKYHIRADNLVLGKTYYARAYVINDVGTEYSQTQETIIPIATKPNVSTRNPSDEDSGTKTVVLHGYISDVGDPAYTERGFVWSNVYDNPTIDDNKIIVDKSGQPGDYEKRVKFDAIDKTINVRAYAINSGGPAYGNTVQVFIFKQEYIVENSIHLGIQREDITKGGLLYWDDANSMCMSSHVGNVNDWRLPTKDELFQLYNLRNVIGGFKTSYDPYSSRQYWSSTSSSSGVYWVISFYNGSSGTWGKNNSRHNARCVRTL